MEIILIIIENKAIDMQAATGVPTSVSDIIQALVIVFTVAGLALVKLPEFKAFTDRVFAKKKEVA